MLSVIVAGWPTVAKDMAVRHFDYSGLAIGLTIESCLYRTPWTDGPVSQVKLGFRTWTGSAVRTLSDRFHNSLTLNVFIFTLQFSIYIRRYRWRWVPTSGRR